MESVERPTDPKITYGDITTKTIKEEENGKTQFFHEFSDEMIEGKFYFTTQSIGFELKNKTNYTMKVLWDNCAFITPTGETQRVIHEGVKLIDRNNAQPSSIIVRNGKITDSLTPSDNIYYVSGEYGGWRYLNLFKDHDIYSNMENVLSEAKEEYLNQVFSVLLSFEIEGNVNDYIFNFKITDIGSEVY
tara:strand:- start:704 stop:1270 length:567 start_codon:yes stop_codon:yes gene_type:complete